MFHFRPFLNSDPPLLTQVWRAQSPMHGLMQPLSVPIFEHFVLSKPYFDREGIIVAEKDGRIAGFVHCGFGPMTDGRELNHARGVICLLQIMPEFAESDLACRLVTEAESFLRRRGANEIIGGSSLPDDPFYLGLYGGSDLPGVLTTDIHFRTALMEAGYRRERVAVAMSGLCSELSFPFDRQHRTFNREFMVQADGDFRLPNWWLSCTLGQTQYTHYQMIERSVRTTHCSVIAWDLEPLASSWGVHAAGLSQLNFFNVDASLRSFFLIQMLRLVQASGVSVVEIQFDADDTPSLQQFSSFGFQEVGRGERFHKTIESSA